MLTNVAAICSSKFDFNSKMKMFTQEASMLGSSFKIGRVYDDACDEGFAIISKKTGNKAVFVLENIISDDSGEDIGAWKFNCVTPGLTQLQVVIFND
jgi:hypothetical protein